MAHNNRVRGALDPWLVVAPIDFARFDTNLANAINGVDGSTHGPFAPIVIGGAGLSITGPLVVARGGLFQVTSAGGILLADNDWPQYSASHAGRTPARVYGLTEGVPWAPGTWRVRMDGCLQSIASSVDYSDGSGPQPLRWRAQFRAWDQATIASVTVTLRVGWPHTSLPSTMPGVRVIRVDESGNVTPMTSVAAGGDGAGYVYASTPSNASLWTGQQSITVPCDQANVVDVTSYTYYLDLVEEQGLSGYPWSLVMKQPVRVATTQFQVLGSGLVTIDGVAVNDGDRVLTKNLTTVNGNGIYIARSGTWSRAPDLTDAGDFTQGMIVPVTEGIANSASYWQAATSRASWPGSAATGDSDTIAFVPRGEDDDDTTYNTATAYFGHGNIWQTARVQYSGLTQQTWQ